MAPLQLSSETYYHGNNILGLFNASPDFPFTASETKRDYY